MAGPGRSLDDESGSTSSTRDGREPALSSRTPRAITTLGRMTEEELACLEPRRGRGRADPLQEAWPGESRATGPWAGHRRGGPVCILDSGIEAGHPLVGAVAAPVASRSRGRRGRSSRRTPRATCAATAPPAPGSSARSRRTASSSSVRVLGAGFHGQRRVLLAGLRWAIEQGYDVINMSLSTTKQQVRVPAARARRHRLLPAHDARRLGAQHAGRELPVAVLVRDLGREPRARRSPRVLLQPLARRLSSSRAESMSRSRGSAAGAWSARATASPRRTSRVSPRSSSPSTPS